jgi:hypothetical protein
MASPSDFTARAIAAVQEINGDADQYRLLFRYPKFLGGSLYVVQFMRDGQKFENYVFFRNGTERVAKNTNHLVELANQEAEHGPLRRSLSELVNVASIIAFLLTFVICYLVLAKGVTEIPPILSTSLSTIIGFYFGTKTSREK